MKKEQKEQDDLIIHSKKQVLVTLQYEIDLKKDTEISYNDLKNEILIYINNGIQKHIDILQSVLGKPGYNKEAQEKSIKRAEELLNGNWVENAIKKEIQCTIQEFKLHTLRRQNEIEFCDE